MTMDTHLDLPYTRTYKAALVVFALCWLVSFFKEDALVGVVALICIPVLTTIAILRSPAHQSLMFRFLFLALGIGLVVTLLTRSLVGPFIIEYAFIITFILAVGTKFVTERQSILLK
jgi:hypothetical protein